MQFISVVYTTINNKNMTNESTRRVHTSAKANGPNPDSVSGLLPKFNGSLLVQDVYDKIIVIKIRLLFSGDMSNVAKKALSHNVEESLKKFLDSDPEADNFQNFISSFLSTDISVVKFSQRSGRSVVFT